MTVNEKICYLMRKKGVAPELLSELSGLSMNSISNYISSKTKPRTNEQRSRIADALGCEVEYLVDDDSPVPDLETQEKPAPALAKEEAPAEESALDATPVDLSGRNIVLEVQWEGKAITFEKLSELAVDAVHSDGDIALYLKPEENMLYYVCGDESGGIAL